MKTLCEIHRTPKGQPQYSTSPAIHARNRQHHPPENLRAWLDSKFTSKQYQYYKPMYIQIISIISDVIQDKKLEYLARVIPCHRT
jgi:hypothetical protein